MALIFNDLQTSRQNNLKQLLISKKRITTNQFMFLELYKRGANDFWRYLLTIIAVIFAYFIGQLPLGIVLLQKMGISNGGGVNPEQVAEFSESMDFEKYGISLNYGLFLILLSFFFAFIALYLLVTRLHKRPFQTLITPDWSINWGKIFFAFGLWMLLSLGMELIAYQMDSGNYSYHFDASQFWMLLLIALTFLVIQTSFEELLMRGYLMQGIASISAYRWIPLLITSVLFGSLHIANPEVSKFGTTTMMTYYMGTGLFLGIITLMDDSLELALGIHAATNIYSAVFVTFSSSALQTPAVFQMKEVNIGLMIPAYFIGAVIFTIICARKYKWTDWSKTYGLVERTEMEP